MNLIVTCGPGIEPIDEVRRITNFSTGELGVLLAEKLAAAGHRVFCLKGNAATHADPRPGVTTLRFDTNDDLLKIFRELGQREKIDAVFHAAALCDYRVKRVLDASGVVSASAKLESRSGGLTLELEPAPKVIAGLRGIFPESLLVGWKYELAGTRDEAMAKALCQIDQCHTDACLLNGRAWGTGFAFIHPGQPLVELASKAEVAEFLRSWIDPMGSALTD